MIKNESNIKKLLERFVELEDNFSKLENDSKYHMLFLIFFIILMIFSTFVLYLHFKL